MITKNKAKNQNSVNANQIADLQSMEKRVNKLTARLWAGLFILFIMLAAGTLLFANLYYERLALALTGNYTMTSGDLLTAGDWNTLSDDFVDKSGDTMSGNLTVNGDITANNICKTGGNCVGDALLVCINKEATAAVGDPEDLYVSCPEGYTITGCVSRCTGYTDDNDVSFKENNTCWSGDHKCPDTRVVNARCCRIE